MQVTIITVNYQAWLPPKYGWLLEETQWILIGCKAVEKKKQKTVINHTMILNSEFQAALAILDLTVSSPSLENKDIVLSSFV